MHILVFNRMVARSENVRCKNKLIHTPRSQEGNYTADKNIICKWELFAARSKLFAFHPVAATLAKASSVFVTVVFFVQLQLFIFFVVTVRIALFHQTSLFISHPCLHCSSVPPLSFHTDTHIECQAHSLGILFNVVRHLQRQSQLVGGKYSHFNSDTDCCPVGLLAPYWINSFLSQLTL